ncbi:hypothetical protein KR215_012168 [Drosophila sulfurigaster]|nr:hypothetical protein KR215_012168 [Drosophila sulfurigaster]
MQLLVLLSFCCLAAALEATQKPETTFLPRYTLLSESKKGELQLDRQPNTEQQPWRRLSYSNYGNNWPAAAPAASLAALLGPGLLLLGVNLGALLYMLLGLLGLAPTQRLGAWQAAEFYRNDRREQLGAGKEADMYLLN